MIKKISRLSFLFAFLFSITPAYAAGPAGEQLSSAVPSFAPALFPVAVPSASGLYAEKAGSKGYYLDPAELDFSAVPPAPRAGSRADREDFETLLAWQESRTGGQCSAAAAESNHSFEVFFGAISPFGSPTPPEVARFFKNVEKDSVAAHRFLKAVYNRDRPFLRDSRIKPCVPRVAGFAYPSGHATMSRLLALILGDLVPSRRAEFIARADESALYRVIAGVHHPTDIEAGRLLANEVYAYLAEDEAFAADMKSMKNYLR